MGRPRSRLWVSDLPSLAVARRRGDLVDGATSATVRWAGGSAEVKVAWACASVRLGGRRPWWVCPRCARRSGTLFLLGAGLRCRRCLRLGYVSQAEGPRERARRRYGRIVQTIAGGELDVDWPRIPARPAGMWRRRYAALVREAERAAERFDELPVRGA